MNGAELPIFLALTVVGFVFSALFSGLETGIYTFNRVRLTVKAARGEPALRAKCSAGMIWTWDVFFRRTDSMVSRLG